MPDAKFRKFRNMSLWKRNKNISFSFEVQSLVFVIGGVFEV